MACNLSEGAGAYPILASSVYLPIPRGFMGHDDQTAETSLAYIAYVEAWAFSSSSAEVRLKHDASTGEIKGTIAVVAMTRIALGDQNLKKRFLNTYTQNHKNLS